MFGKYNYPNKVCEFGLVDEEELSLRFNISFLSDCIAFSGYRVARGSGPGLQGGLPPLDTRLAL
jgi:hypothetical protein